MNEVGSVAEIDIRLTVRPALYNDATRLVVEWKQCSVQFTRSFHHSTKPPSHPASVMDVHPKPVEVFLRIKVRRAAVDNNSGIFISQKTGKTRRPSAPVYLLSWK